MWKFPQCLMKGVVGIRMARVDFFYPPPKETKNKTKKKQSSLPIYLKFKNIEPFRQRYNLLSIFPEIFSWSSHDFLRFGFSLKKKKTNFSFSVTILPPSHNDITCWTERQWRVFKCWYVKFRKFVWDSFS